MFEFQALVLLRIQERFTCVCREGCTLRPLPYFFSPVQKGAHLVCLLCRIRRIFFPRGLKVAMVIVDYKFYDDSLPLHKENLQFQVSYLLGKN